MEMLTSSNPFWRFYRFLDGTFDCHMWIGLIAGHSQSHRLQDHEVHMCRGLGFNRPGQGSWHHELGLDHGQYIGPCLWWRSVGALPGLWSRLPVVWAAGPVSAEVSFPYLHALVIYLPYPGLFDVSSCS